MNDTKRDIPSTVVADVAAEFYDDIYDEPRGVHYMEIGRRLSEAMGEEGTVTDMWACDIVAETVDLAVEDVEQDRDKRDLDDAVDEVLRRMDPGQ